MTVPTDSFLNGFWRDVLTIVGGCGFLLTGIGVWLALIQMWRTATAASAATQAALDALAESRSQYNKYVIGLAYKLLGETRLHVRNGAFDVAAMRLGDLGELLIQVASDDSAWSSFVVRVHGMEASFEKIFADQTKLSDSLKGKWRRLDRELRMKIAENFGPFSMDVETDHAIKTAISRNSKRDTIKVEREPR